MLLWASTQEKVRIPADSAHSQTDYLCPECGNVVRVRQGTQRIPHFFHMTKASSCHLYDKNNFHQSVQLYLVEQIGKENCSQESHFSEISRVADIAWHAKKIVFEVQVSPINPKVALQRTHDYWSIGWHVIWLLHVKQFGKAHASPFEKALLQIPHYFTDIGFLQGSIWDEVSTVQGSQRRWWKFPPLRRHINTIIPYIRISPKLPVLATQPKTIQEWLAIRQRDWSCHLNGDYMLDSLELSRNTYKRRSFFKKLHLFLRLLWYRLIR